MTYDGGELRSNEILFETVCAEETFEEYLYELNSTLSSQMTLGSIIEFEINGD